jgi:hypothetical protein
MGVCMLTQYWAHSCGFQHARSQERVIPVNVPFVRLACLALQRREYFLAQFRLCLAILR